MATHKTTPRVSSKGAVKRYSKANYQLHLPHHCLRSDWWVLPGAHATEDSYLQHVREQVQKAASKFN